MTIRVEEIALGLEAIASVVEAIALRLERWPFGCVFPNLFEFLELKKPVDPSPFPWPQKCVF